VIRHSVELNLAVVTLNDSLRR